MFIFKLLASKVIILKTLIQKDTTQLTMKLIYNPFYKVSEGSMSIPKHTRFYLQIPPYYYKVIVPINVQCNICFAFPCFEIINPKYSMLK